MPLAVEAQQTSPTVHTVGLLPPHDHYRDREYSAFVGGELDEAGCSMVKLLYIIAPKAGMSRADFERYWLEVHAPIVKKIPHLERYVINICRPRSDGTPAAIGGVAELWFGSLETMKTALGTAAAGNARADIENFTEVGLNVSGLVDEHVVVQGST